jgi:hypothetical protein
MKQDNVELYQDDDGVFRFKGKIHLITEETKSVVVDGETYTKSHRYEKEFDLEELKITTNIQSYDFELLNYTVSIEDSSYYNYMNRAFRVEYSKDQYVNNIIILHRKKLLDPRIKSIYTSKNRAFQCGMDWESILRNSQVPIEMFEYGWNNSLYYTIGIQDLFEMDYKSIPKEIVDIFSNNGVSLRSKNEIEKIIRFTNQKINNT